MKHLFIFAVCVIALAAVAPLRGDTPASQPAAGADGLAPWMKGQKKAAVDSFVHADWTSGAFVASDPLLGMTEAAFEADVAGDPAKQKELTDKTNALKSLGPMVLNNADSDANGGSVSEARLYFTAVRDCGKYLSSHDGELTILKQVGKALVGAAEQRLAKLPK